MTEKMDQREKYWLSSEDFDVLDRILGQHGFGGYYDLLDVLKGIISKVDIMKKLKKDSEKDIKTLPEAIGILSFVTDYS